MKSRFFVLSCILGVLGILVAGCSQTTASMVKAVNMEETYPTSSVSLENVYESLEEIAADADLIAVVEVLENTIVDLEGYPQVHTQAKVTKVLKGQVPVDTQIEIVEEGGKPGEVLGGIPELNSKQPYVLFLQQHEGKYYICGAYQGRFIVREDHVFQQADAETKLKAYTPVTVKSFYDTVTK